MHSPPAPSCLRKHCEFFKHGLRASPQHTGCGRPAPRGPRRSSNTLKLLGSPPDLGSPFNWSVYAYIMSAWVGGHCYKRAPPTLEALRLKQRTSLMPSPQSTVLGFLCRSPLASGHSDQADQLLRADLSLSSALWKVAAQERTLPPFLSLHAPTPLTARQHQREGWVLLKRPRCDIDGLGEEQ